MHQRLETFCDGIFAIAITLLILDIKVPSADLIRSSGDLTHELLLNWPSWFAFILSFISLFIAWINHHHMIEQLNQNRTSNIFMYAHGLFVLTIIIYPFTTSFLAEYLNTPYLQTPVFLYCLLNTIHGASWVLLMHCAIHPINLGATPAKSIYLVKTRSAIAYAVIFNLAMCALTFWLPMVAVVLTALAWIIYLIMGITLTPLEE